MDRVKEALFNILGTDVQGSVWLDLFAGTGSVGIEALSRGASEVVFVDNSRQAVRIIHENLEHTGLSAGAHVVQSDAFIYLDRTPSRQFDTVYIAPPQYKGLWKQALLKLDASPGWLHPEALVIIQIDPHEQEAITLKRLEAYDERRYGNTLLWFFEKPGE